MRRPVRTLALFKLAKLISGDRFWWKKRRDRKMQYSQVHNFHDDSDTTNLWPRQSVGPRYSDYHAEAYELPPTQHTELKDEPSFVADKVPDSP